MLYLICGSDTQKTRERTRMLLNALIKKRPDAANERLVSSDVDPSTMAHYVGTQGLFAARVIVTIDMTEGETESEETLLDLLSDLQKSENIFIVLYGVPTKKVIAAYQKHAEKVEEHTAADIRKDLFNVFLLSDALGKRDALALWTLYQRAKHAHASDEEIHGILLWGTRAMLATKQAKSASEAGLNPFVYKKASTFVRNYSFEELREISRNLIMLYHDVRLGRYSLDIGLERFILALK